MRKIVFQAHADTIGSDTAELVCFRPNADRSEVTDQYLDQYADDFGRDHWDMYMPNIGEDEYDYSCEDEYYEQCGAWWEEYNPTEHNGVIDSDAEGYEED